MDRCPHLDEDDDGWATMIHGHWYLLCADCASVLEKLADKRVKKSEALTE